MAAIAAGAEGVHTSASATPPYFASALVSEVEGKGAAGELTRLPASGVGQAKYDVAQASLNSESYPDFEIEDESRSISGHHEGTEQGQAYQHACQQQNQCWRWGAIGRSYYVNDQRIEFTGQEATFGVEGVLQGSYSRVDCDWESSVVGEIFLNQPFDRNVLIDTPERESYRGNFEVDIVELKQLYISSRNGDFYFAFGKMLTPFGRSYFPLYTNDFHDAPFIRSEAILWRETAAVAQWDPSWFVATVGISNGGDERDTNSSKALVARVGVEGDTIALGASIKKQDGISSEGQKTFNNHIGIDGMVRMGNFRLSGEAIYDEYGFRRPFDPLGITWGRSIYYRDMHNAMHVPLTGVGYYLNLDHQAHVFTTTLNYGEFYPKPIGDARHDAVNRRGIVKLAVALNEQLSAYGMGLVENDLANAQDGRYRHGWEILSGFQFSL